MLGTMDCAEVGVNVGAGFSVAVGVDVDTGVSEGVNLATGGVDVMVCTRVAVNAGVDLVGKGEALERVNSVGAAGGLFKQLVTARHRRK